MSSELLAPIPDFSELRATKTGYDLQDIDTQHPLHDDPLVNLRDEYGINAQSYYARPNKMTGKPLPGIPDAPLARRDVAERLARVNERLATDEYVVGALGSDAVLLVADAIRPHRVQQYAYNVAWPQVLRAENPGVSDDEIQAMLPKFIAKPKDHPTATPHITGGAVDVRLMNLKTGAAFNRGDGTHRAFPDYFEDDFVASGEVHEKRLEDIASLTPEELREIVTSRRVLYNVMREAGLAVNPTEIWHYGIGDPLSGFVDGYKPYYGVAELPEWYSAQLGK